MMPRFRLDVNRISRLFWPGLLIFLLAACDGISPAPPPDDLIAPRQLATVVISPTPVETLVVPPTPTRMASPTATRLPPTATPTATPYAGVFMGDGSAPLILPTASIAALVEATLQPPTPLGGEVAVVFPTATPLSGLSSAPVNAGAVSSGACPYEPAAVFQSGYYSDGAVSAAIGCPSGPAETIFMAQQTFERGTMFWWSIGDIYALSSDVVSGQTNTYWQMQDRWQEGMADDDPSMTNPPGLLQPIRGFGLAWRTNAQVRNAIGWALANEDGYSGTYQRFERGIMFTTQTGGVYALAAEGRYFGPLF
jgi:hypothetical protein